MRNSMKSGRRYLPSFTRRPAKRPAPAKARRSRVAALEAGKDPEQISPAPAAAKRTRVRLSTPKWWTRRRGNAQKGDLALPGSRVLEGMNAQVELRKRKLVASAVVAAAGFLRDLNFPPVSAGG